MSRTEEGLVAVPGLLSRWVRLGNGALAHYMTSGETGPAVILLHGGIQGSSGAAGWRFMAPFLGQNGFRVLLLINLDLAMRIQILNFHQFMEQLAILTSLMNSLQLSV